MAASLPRALGFVGLGSMGKSVASTLVRKLPVGISVNVYDANERVTKDFLSCHDEVVGHDDAAGVLQNSEMTFICVPTTSHTKSILSEAPDGVNNPTVVDLTSGAPDEVKEVAALAKDKGFSFVEAPLSGGPAGALAGTLTTFVAGPTDTYQKAKPLISLFSSNKFHLSETPGAGSATKSVNNCLNMMNLLSASEGLLSLAKFGVKAEDAVAAINNSSGRSLQTQVRIPKEVLSGEYNYGFFLKLMKKDVGIGTKFVDGDLIGKDFFSLVESLEKEVGGDEDYTASVKGLGVAGSKEAALNLLTGSGPKADPEAYMPSQIKLLVCDMAGTTVEEGGLVYQTLFNVLQEAGVDLTFDEIDAWHGAHKLKVVEHFVNRHEFGGVAELDDAKFRDRSDAIHDNFVEGIKRAYFDSDNIQLIRPGLKEHFNDFRAKGVKIGLNTGYPVEIQDAIIKKLDMQDFVDTWVSAQNWGGRPKAHMIHACMRNVGIDDVREVAKAGDTVLDIQEGVQAGVGFNIGVLSGADGVATLRNQGADVVLDDILQCHVVR